MGRNLDYDENSRPSSRNKYRARSSIRDLAELYYDRGYISFMDLTYVRVYNCEKLTTIV